LQKRDVPRNADQYGEIGWKRSYPPSEGVRATIRDDEEREGKAKCPLRWHPKEGIKTATTTQIAKKSG